MMKPKVCDECEFRVGSEFILKSEHGKILSENRVLRVNYEKLKEEYEKQDETLTDAYLDNSNLKDEFSNLKEECKIHRERAMLLGKNYRHIMTCIPKEKVRKVLDNSRQAEWLNRLDLYEPQEYWDGFENACKRIKKQLLGEN